MGHGAAQRSLGIRDDDDGDDDDDDDDEADDFTFTRVKFRLRHV